MKNKNKIYIITLVLIIIDQLIKIIIKSNMELYQEIKIIKNFFSIMYLKNSGAAFSILENKTILLILFSVCFILIIGKFIKKESDNFNKIELISLGMILGGVFGNLIDRIIYKGVIDYLSFKIINYNFPVFNLADICITIGAFILIVDSLFLRKKS